MWWILGIPVWILSGWPMYWSVRNLWRYEDFSWTVVSRAFWLPLAILIGPLGWPIALILFLMTREWSWSEKPAKW